MSIARGIIDTMPRSHLEDRLGGYEDGSNGLIIIIDEKITHYKGRDGYVRVRRELKFLVLLWNQER